MTKQLADMHPDERRSYEEGQSFESHVAVLLTQAGFKNVAKGTREQDLYHDIDLVGEDSSGKRVTFSVKTNTPKYYSSPFVFELFAKYANRQKPTPSWYYTGKADFYAVYKTHYRGGGTLYLVSKSALVAEVNANSWCRETRQTKAVAATQAAWKKIEWTSLGLIKVDRLLDANIAHVIADDVQQRS